MSARCVEGIGRASGALAVVTVLAGIVGCAAGTPPSRSAGDVADLSPGEDAALAAHDAAVAALGEGRYADAERELLALIDEHPELPGPYVNAAIAYRRLDRDDDALAMLEHAREIDPGHPQGNNQLGILLRERGDFDAAEAAYRRSLEREPDYSLALYNLGVLLDVYLDRKTEALASYERYQSTLAEPDETVARWIIDLRRRVPVDGDPERVAQGEP